VPGAAGARLGDFHLSLHRPLAEQRLDLGRLFLDRAQLLVHPEQLPLEHARTQQRRDQVVAMREQIGKLHSSEAHQARE
jgi:hypothetical protein